MLCAKFISAYPVSLAWATLALLERILDDGASPDLGRRKKENMREAERSGYRVVLAGKQFLANIHPNFRADHKEQKIHV